MPSAIRRDPRPISVVVPTWNAGARFHEVLGALAEQDIEDGFELVVVDSGSTDGTADAALDAGAYVFKIPQREFNHGRTRNLGIERSSGAIVCLLTQDAKPMDASYLRRLTEVFDDPRVDGAYARQFPRPDCDPLLAERLRRWSASRDELSFSSLVAGDPEASLRRFEELAPMERYLHCAFDDVASSVRRSTWERHPLPERDFGEDVAWAREVLLAGGTIVFAPEARVEHSHRIDMRREFGRIYCDHRNLAELFELENVPTPRDVLRGWKWQRNFYRELLSEIDLGRAERLYWRAYSIPYALAETAAQYLGGHAREKARESVRWARFDRRMTGGA